MDTKDLLNHKLLSFCCANSMQRRHSTAAKHAKLKLSSTMHIVKTILIMYYIKSIYQAGIPLNEGRACKMSCLVSLMDKKLWGNIQSPHSSFNKVHVSGKGLKHIANQFPNSRYNKVSMRHCMHTMSCYRRTWNILIQIRHTMVMKNS